MYFLRLPVARTISGTQHMSVSPKFHLELKVGLKADQKKMMRIPVVDTLVLQQRQVDQQSTRIY